MGVLNCICMNNILILVFLVSVVSLQERHLFNYVLRLIYIAIKQYKCKTLINETLLY